MKRIIETLQLVRRRWAMRAPVRTRAVEAGMTLLEIMIVLALIGMVMGAIGFGLNSYFKKGQIKTAKITVKSIAGAAQQYMMENNSNCPASLDDLIQNKNMTNQQKKDPWGKEYQMKCPGTGDTDGVDITSSGPDKQDATGDDIKSWEQ